MKVVIDVNSSIKTRTNLCYNFHTFMLEPQLLPVIHYNLVRATESQREEVYFEPTKVCSLRKQWLNRYEQIKNKYWRALLNCFWMGFLLFLPAYMQSPGGIMISRSVEVTGALRRTQNNFTWGWRKYPDPRWKGECTQIYTHSQLYVTEKSSVWNKYAGNSSIPKSKHNNPLKTA